MTQSSRDLKLCQVGLLASLFVVLALSLLASGSLKAFGVGNYTFISKWGSAGSGDGLFDKPTALAVDGRGYVYVADTGNNRIQKFDGAGSFILKWGSEGSGDGQFSGPTGIAVDIPGNVYVADSGNNRIEKFTPAGRFINAWDYFDLKLGQSPFGAITGISVDSSGVVRLSNALNHKVNKFSADGEFISSYGSNGFGATQFSYPSGLAMTDSGKLYVVDSGNYRIKFAGSSSSAPFGDPKFNSWGSQGSEDGQFDGPTGISIDSQGFVYVADTGNNRIQKFDGAGSFILKWGSEGSGDGQFSGPTGIAVDSSGNVYVSDSGNNRIEKFAVANSPAG